MEPTDNLLAGYLGVDPTGEARLPTKPVDPCPEMTTVTARPRTMAANKQMFDQSSLRQSEVSHEMYTQGKGLANDAPPNFALLREKPEHRIMLLLKAQGMTNQEIATHTGYTYGWVCQVVRQPWFRKAFLDICEEMGKDAVETFLKAEVIPSLVTLTEIRDNLDAKDASRVTAANSLLDRFLGKPTQRVETENTTKGLDAAVEEVDKLTAQIASLRQQNGLGESVEFSS